MEDLIYSTIKVVLEAMIVSGILSYFFLNREMRLKKTIEAEFNKMDEPFVFTYDFPDQPEKNFNKKYHAFRSALKVDEKIK